MSTLDRPPVAPLLRAMFAESERSHARFRELTDSLRARGVPPGSPEYADAAREAYLSVTVEGGRLLYMLARARGARRIVEFGASFGLSTIHLAAALRDNGGGLLVATEIEPTKAARTRASLVQAGLDDLVEIREGDAMQTLAVDPPGPIELLFLDGPDQLYQDVLGLLEPQLAPAAVVVADNAASSGFHEHIRHREGFLSVEVGPRVAFALLAEPPRRGGQAGAH